MGIQRRHRRAGAGGRGRLRPLALPVREGTHPGSARHEGHELLRPRQGEAEPGGRAFPEQSRARQRQRDE